MPPIYHITHVDNLVSIVRAGCLWCDTERIHQGFACRGVGYRHIKDRRLRRPVPVAAGGMLGDYVPFYFCNRSVMLYVLYRGHQDYQSGQEPVVHLVSSTEAAIACGRPWGFTDRHAELAYAYFADNAEHMDRIDWAVMGLRQWGGDGELRERRQAEFLVHLWFPWPCIHQIGVHNRKIAAQVNKILASADHKPTVTVEPTWYY